MPLEQLIGLLQQNKYIYSIIVLVAFFLLSEFVVILFEKFILRLTKKTKTEVDDLIIRKINKPLSWILLFIGIRIAVLPLGIKESILNPVQHFLSSLIVVVVTYIAIAVIDIIIDNWGKKIAQKTESKLDDQILPVFHKFSRIFISIIGLLFVLPLWGIQIGPLLTSLGIAGVAVAFALQSSLANIFGGVSIILDKSIKVGDKIKLDNETMGSVMDIGLRSTKIQTWDGEFVTIPNGKLADSRILNFTQPANVRVAIDFGVEYGSEPAKVRKVVMGVIERLPDVIKEPAPKVLMTEMSDFALKFRALFWVKSFEVKFDTKALAIEDIYNALNKAGIGIPFPTRTVYVADKDKKLKP